MSKRPKRPKRPKQHNDHCTTRTFYTSLLYRVGWFPNGNTLRMDMRLVKVWVYGSDYQGK